MNATPKVFAGHRDRTDEVSERKLAELYVGPSCRAGAEACDDRTTRPAFAQPAVPTSGVEPCRTLLSSGQDRRLRTGTDGAHRSPVPCRLPSTVRGGWQ